MIRKIIGIAVCLAAMIIQANAQELGIELNGGLQGMRYQLQKGQSQQLAGGSLGLSYGFRLSNRWDLLTGITGGIYRTQATLQDGLVFTYGQVDDAGSAFLYNVKVTGYKETQQFFTVSIPLLLQYHTPGVGVQWYFNGGGKVFVPFNNSIRVSADQLVLSGHYPDFNLEVSDLPQHGFGTIKGWKASAITKLRPAVALSAATGLSFNLSPGKRLYAGVYADYGLTRLKEKNDSLPLATYSSTGIAGVRAGSVLNMANTSQVILLSFGLQLRLSFGSARPKPAARPNIKKEPPPPANSTIGDEEAESLRQPVLFGLIGESSIPEAQKPHLDEVAEILKRYPAIRLSIVGHICNSGTEIENPKVGEARARAVARYLRDKGIDRRRMDISFIRGSDPVVPGDPPANYQNRRVVINYLSAMYK